MLEQLLQRATDEQGLTADFHTLCDFGGRIATGPGVEQALAWALGRLAQIGNNAKRLEVGFDAWRCNDNSLIRLPGAQVLACKPLLRSASTGPRGIEANVIDLGRGTEADFEKSRDLLAASIALVRHEYPFSREHIHRRRKYAWAVDAGAAGFLIANPVLGAGLLGGSSGRVPGQTGIPAAYIDAEAAAQLAASAQGHARARLTIQGEDYPARTGISILDIPGHGPERIVISAHIDGHDLGESALDNATGVAVTLAVARVLAPAVAACPRGLLVCLFSGEEWALSGSARYLDDMPEGERRRLRLNINLDTVAGDGCLSALTSGFAGLASLVTAASRASGVPLDVYLPLMPNSDHYNFARHAIPALRLVAGFDRPDSRVRHILCATDTRDKVEELELRNALRVACAMAWHALTMPEAELAALSAVK